MGRVTHLDAGVLIGFLSEEDEHHIAATQVVYQGLEGDDRLVTAASALAECLVKPARAGESRFQDALHLIDSIPVYVRPLTTPIARKAAHLRAAHKALKLPDALVIATAIHSEAQRLVTTDRRWPAIDDDLRIEVIC